MDWIYFLNLVGVFVFAISGTLTAIDNDVVGATIIGFITALGGGTLRDILIGETPVGWMQDSVSLYVIVVAVICSYLFKTSILKLLPLRYSFLYLLFPFQYFYNIQQVPLFYIVQFSPFISFVFCLILSSYKGTKFSSFCGRTLIVPNDLNKRSF